MPAASKAIRRAAAIAEHHPEKLYKRNRGLLSMTKGELHKYAATKEKGLPKKKKKHNPGNPGSHHSHNPGRNMKYR